MESGRTYHVYNRANGFENLFREERNYYYFLEKYVHYIQPLADTMAFCLMPNHFHLMLRIKDEKNIVQQFSNLFNAYTKAINKTYNRYGSLFQRPFKRKLVANDAYFTQLILYIHNNPVKHGFADSPWHWPYSSLNFSDPTGFKNLSGLKTNSAEVVQWFGGQEPFDAAHRNIRKIDSVFE